MGHSFPGGWVLPGAAVIHERVSCCDGRVLTGGCKMQLRRVSWTDGQTAHAREGGAVRDWSCIYVCTGWSIGRRKRRPKSPSSTRCTPAPLALSERQQCNTPSKFQRFSVVKIRDPHPPPSRSAPDSLRLELDAGQYARADGCKRLKSPCWHDWHPNPTLTRHPLERLPEGSARNTTF
jgi:hypothetical protein